VRYEGMVDKDDKKKSDTVCGLVFVGPLMK
jgi:hypothetical protein